MCRALWFFDDGEELPFDGYRAFRDHALEFVPRRLGRRPSLYSSAKTSVFPLKCSLKRPVSMPAPMM